MEIAENSTRLIRCTYRVDGLDCPDCAATLERGIREIDGVVSAQVHYGTASLDVALEAAADAALRDRVAAMGYRLAAPDEPADASLGIWEQHGTLILTTLAVLAWLAGGILSISQLPRPAAVVFGISLLIGGLPVFRRALAAVRARSIDLYVLMTLAVIGAGAMGEWGEGAAVVVLFAIGEWLQAMTTRRARQAVSAVVATIPERAIIRRAGREVSVPVGEVQVGETAIVRPGEQIPLDGHVISGASSVNEATITGEAVPRIKGIGDTVFAGTLNERGALEIAVDRLARESALAHILQLINEAQQTKPRVQQQIDRFARYYTPVMLLLAVLVGAWGLATHAPITRALALLIVGCPCALVLASPIAMIAGISRAARHGMLVKQGAFLETGSYIKAVAFDKTGTLTLGTPHVHGTMPADGVGEDTLLALAAGLEYYSEHPLGQAICRAAERAGVTPAEVTDFEALTGLGVAGRYAGETVRLGAPRLWSALPAPWLDRVRVAEATGMTVLVLARGETVLGLLALADEPRAEAAGVVRALSEEGYAVSLLTGDTPQAARFLGRQVGITDLAARLLPAEKVGRAGELRAQYGPVAMIGDGVNDAPALAAADLGIAVASAGSDTALASADVILTGDNLSALPGFFALCRRTVGVVRQNIAFAVAVKVGLIALALAGALPLWLAVIGDVGTTLVVILSSMRLLR